MHKQYSDTLQLMFRTQTNAATHLAVAQNEQTHQSQKLGDLKGDLDRTREQWVAYQNQLREDINRTTQDLRRQLEEGLQRQPPTTPGQPIPTMTYELVLDKFRLLENRLDELRDHQLATLRKETQDMRTNHMTLLEENHKLRQAVSDLQHPTEHMRNAIMTELAAQVSMQVRNLAKTELQKATDSVIADLQKNSALHTQHQAPLSPPTTHSGFARTTTQPPHTSPVPFQTVYQGYTPQLAQASPFPPHQYTTPLSTNTFNSFTPQMNTTQYPHPLGGTTHNHYRADAT